MKCLPLLLAAVVLSAAVLVEAQLLLAGGGFHTGRFPGGSPYPRPIGQPPCGGRFCRPGQSCVRHQFQCFAAPCLPVYQCA
ncbi:hypothetical protein V5799_022942 [Amblyomma americanum]|uniref:Secreted protein n=1 Tax=Amblyomma americanum TaxID=6943 RepID=A0AAQ4FJN9_AMBAM